MKTPLTILYLLSSILVTLAAVGGGGVAITPGRVQGGTLTLNNQYTYAPVTVTTTNVGYAGVYLFAGTDTYGKQYATNSSGACLSWDSSGAYFFAWLLSDGVGGTVYFIDNGTDWVTALSDPTDITGVTVNTYTAFRTISANGAVSLPDDVWQPDIVNGTGTLNLNNNYQRLTIDGASSGSFEISALANTATGRPRWTVLKIYNSSGSSCAITFSYTTRHLNTAISAIADDKVAIVSIYDDGLGNSDSIVTASKVEP